MIAARAGYALWAETWDATPSPIVAAEERVLRPWLDGAAGARVIDVGCGTGRWMARTGAIGIDASWEMLAVAARKPAVAGRLAAGDAAALPVAGGCADLVLCTLTLGHVRDRAAAVCELVRILRRGGTLILTDFHPDAVARGWRRTFRHQGSVYELEHYPYTPGDISSDCSALALAECAEARIEEPERELFAQAGRPGLFETARGLPAVLLTRWTRL